MPRLCPHCHKLGISVRKMMWSAAGPVECSHCHTILVRKQEWSRYILVLLVPYFLIARFVLHLTPEQSLLIGIPLFMVLTYFHYRFANFVPVHPGEKQCTSANGS